ncbi:alkaline-phosphatase-like protein [Leucosporidium creatinivorum]|uniref:GPI ethanolamine phosphate transferase 2 n=1 Tax=Leucosporidium creatinivorum TaxID=106004 RepID=A0A1Y2G2Y2_9BASI|nr:alkaline-phosphatase-like protein [Leucosporidium creatinivorum]
MKRSLVQQLSLLLVTLLGIALFARGFFPVKPLLPGFAESPPAFLDRPPFSRLVFILVDALRSDFAFGPESKMDFVHSIVDSGHALPFTAIAQAPTVTLPRLKALTTGSNPTFLDAILNIAEDSKTAVFENVDSWVRQLALGPQRKRIVFAGDDTWLRIFPRSWFASSEGVSSFFVTDTQTVDNNVTRHLDDLLVPSSPSPFDVLILHYLGLDHVGHLGGPESPLMAPKQIEMDGIVERVFRLLEQQDQLDGEKSLLVLIGDHGMTETGNHGGSTEGETSAALLIAAPSHPPIPPPPAPRYHTPYRHHQVVNQIDLVPTLALLFGIGIPTNSMGKLIQSVIKAYGSSDYAAALKANVEQIKAVLEAASPGATVELLQEIARSAIESGGEEPTTEEAMSQFLTLAQKRLMSTFGDYHLAPMALGLAVLALLVFLAGRFAIPYLSREGTTTRRAVGAALAVHLATFFATSFIEEEHEFWYFATTTLLLALALRPGLKFDERASFAVSAGTVRLMRSWSHNGQKDIPNTSLSAYLSTSPSLTTLLASLTYLILILIPIYTLYTSALTLSRRTTDIPLKHLLIRALTFAVLLTFALLDVGVLVAFKAAVGGNEIGWLKGLGLGTAIELALLSKKLGGLSWITARVAKVFDPTAGEAYDVLKNVYICIGMARFSRPTSLFLLVLLWWQYRTIRQTRLSPLLFTTTIIALQHVSFFAAGGSNSLATIDLSQAYSTLESYDFGEVAFATFAGNFAGPLFWTNSAPALIRYSPSSHSTLTSHFILSTLFHSLSLFTLAASATHFRRHLFVWTVFSPALLYKGVWNVLVHWFMGVLVAAIQ